jgi:hypothetical protein
MPGHRLNGLEVAKQRVAGGRAPLVRRRAQRRRRRRHRTRNVVAADRLDDPEVEFRDEVGGGLTYALAGESVVDVLDGNLERREDSRNTA